MDLIAGQGTSAGERARVLVIHFDGALDAGQVGRVAVAQILRSLSVNRVATFDADALIDYRSHRPVLTAEQWVTTSMVTPEIALDLVRDDLGTPFLLLHGPEPDFRWEAFAAQVGQLAREAGVEISVTLHGIPAGSPHTRPTPVHVQATDASLLPEQPQLMSTIQFPSPLSAFLQVRLAEQGIAGVGFLAAVPFYLAEHAHPAGASAVLRRLSDFADLSLPVGDLERGAAEELQVITDLIEDNPDVRRTVAALEEHYDRISGLEGVLPLDGLGASRPDSSQQETGLRQSKDIGEVIEAYLANIEERGKQETAPSDADASQEGAPSESADTRRQAGGAETVEEVLRRLEKRRTDPHTPRSSGGRHRADTGDDAS